MGEGPPMVGAIVTQVGLERAAREHVPVKPGLQLHSLWVSLPPLRHPFLLYVAFSLFGSGCLHCHTGGCTRSSLLAMASVHSFVGVGDFYDASGRKVFHPDSNTVDQIGKDHYQPDVGQDELHFWSVL